MCQRRRVDPLDPLALRPVKVRPHISLTEGIHQLKRSERTFRYYDVEGREYPTTANGTGPSTYHGRFTGVGQQVTLSEGHPWRLLGSTDGNVGGEFLTMRQNYTDTGCSTSQLYSSHRSNSYVGPQFAYKANFDTSSSAWPSAAPSSNLTLGGLGTTAIARCLPTNPVADVSVFVGETLREGIPDVIGRQLLKDKISAGRKAGGEYLNFEFGWKPLVSDISKFSHAVIKTDKVLADYKRGSGKRIRRQYHFPTEVIETKTSLGSVPPTPALVSYMYDQAFGTLTRIDRVQRDRWFSGAFTYYLDLGKDLESKLARHAAEAKKLLGIRMTPDALYNVTPWSWAVDWVSNLGDVVHNVSAFQQDGLVMQYGYMMEHTIASSEYVLEGYRYRDLPPGRMSQTFTTEWKKRIPASPFGFGLFDGDFTPRQLAIIAALVSTKSRRRA